MKLYKHLLATITLGACALTSCSKEDANLAFNNDPNAVNITAGVGDMVSRSNPVGEKPTAFNTNDQVAVSNGTYYISYQFNGSTWSPTNPAEYLKWEKETMTFNAYHPLTANISDFTVPTDQTTLEKIQAADWMTFTGEKTKADGAVNLTFERQMARVIVKIGSFGNQYVDEQRTVYFQHLNKVQPYNNTEGNTGLDSERIALVKPTAQDVDAEFMHINVAGNQLKVLGIPAMEAGKSYTYTLHVGKNKATISTVTVTDWNTGTIEGGEATTPIIKNEANATDKNVNTLNQTLEDTYGADYATRLTAIKVTGTINQADFETIKQFAYIDLSEVTVVGDIQITVDNAPFQKGGNAIPYQLFSTSKILKEIKLPNTITTIGEWAFANCSNLTGELSIPESVTTIMSNAFKDCSGLTGALTIPSKVAAIGNNAFTDCSGFSGTLTIPEGVETIPVGCFRGCLKLTGTLTIPTSVITIDRGAFEDCSRLTGALTIPANVTTVNSSAFEGCSGFDGTLTIPESVGIIGERAFYDCSGLTGALIIPANVTAISKYTFYNCSGFDGILTIPQDVETIGNYAFNGCSKLTGALTIPSKVTTIGNNAFYDCSGFNGALTIPETLTTINTSVFFNCSGLTGALEIPKNWKTIPGAMFYNCKALTGALTIPEGVTVIGDNAFSKCLGFDGTLTLPNSVIEIGSQAFSNCSNLTGALTIPEESKTIGSQAFIDCSGFNGKLSIPISVTTIGNYAFSNCHNFTSIQVQWTATLPEITDQTFPNNFKTDIEPAKEIHIPTGTKTLYTATAGWSPYNLVEQ
jgi:hypothetical protein